MVPYRHDRIMINKWILNKLGDSQSLVLNLFFTTLACRPGTLCIFSFKTADVFRIATTATTCGGCIFRLINSRFWYSLKIQIILARITAGRTSEGAPAADDDDSCFDSSVALELLAPFALFDLLTFMLLPLLLDLCTFFTNFDKSYPFNRCYS